MNKCVRLGCLISVGVLMLSACQKKEIVDTSTESRSNYTVVTPSNLRRDISWSIENIEGNFAGVVGEDTVLYSEPNLDSEVIVTLGKDEQLNVTYRVWLGDKIVGEFYGVDYNDLVCFVESDKIVTSE